MDRHKMYGWHRACLSPVLAFALVLTGTPAFSEDGHGHDDDVTELEEITILGSHIKGHTAHDVRRSVHDSPVPIDVIHGTDLKSYGIRDMNSLLTATVPSYNVNRQPISDAATLIRPANLRGLPPDSTLILINGKRRHRASVISFLGGGLSSGSHGPDISVIPSIALKRVEVLRDGASAQYGSDAIAGAINFVLRDAPTGMSLQATGGRFYEGDGDTVKIAGNIGMPLPGKGFLNVSFESLASDPTSRSVQRTDAQGLITNGNNDVRQPAAQIWGSPEYKYDLKFFGNAGLKLGGGELYAFGNWAERDVEGGFFFRNPNTRGGIFDGGKDSAGEDILKVADLSGNGMGCPDIKIKPGADYETELDNLPGHCFAFNEKFPGGFTPNFGGVVRDWSVALGFKGDTSHATVAWLDDWSYDVSAVLGQSHAQFYLKNTINPQLARLRTDIPTSYELGAYTETDFVIDVDLSRQIDIQSLYSPLSVALGLEYREEHFKIDAGELNSHCIDRANLGDRACPGAIAGNTNGLDAQGFGVGANGFPGFPPDIAGAFSRGSYAVYAEAETKVTRDLLINADVRYEDYNSIGDTLNGKVSTHWQARHDMALRGSVSSGFRAPTVGQMFVRNVSTTFIGSRLSDTATRPPSDPVAIAKGAKPLTPEKSVNVSVGTVLDLGALAITIDYYTIKIKDRITLTSDLMLTDAEKMALNAANVAGADDLTAVRFFTNDFDTTSQGLDVVATYPVRMFGGETLWTAVANWNNTNVDRHDPAILDATRIRVLEEGQPQFRFSLTKDHRNGPWRLLARVHYFDGFFEAFADEASFPIEADARWIVDAEASHAFDNGITASIGAQNLFNTYPTNNPFGGALGAQYAVTAPYGFNGGFYYWRLEYVM